MTAIESIFAIKSAVIDLGRYTSSNQFVSKRVQIKYVQLLDRFFSENDNYVTHEHRQSCLHDMDYFVGLMDETAEHYDSGIED